MPGGRGSNSLEDPELGITGYSGKKKSELVDMLRHH
jgi:hypothetical protein